MASLLFRAPYRSLLIAVVWESLALLSVAFSYRGYGLALVWPANAVLLVALLVDHRRHHVPHIAAVCLASVALNIGFGRTPVTTLGFTLASVGEAVLAAQLIARICPAERLFESAGSIFRFALAATLSCIPSALLAGWLLMTDESAIWWHSALSWMPAHACGLLVITPLLLLMRGQSAALRDRPATWREAGSALAILGLVGAASMLVFRQSSYPLLFLIVPALLFATFHLRERGAAASVMIIAIIASYNMIQGVGPLAALQSPMIERAYVLELFIATMFLCALPLAAVLNERDRLAGDATQHLANLRSVAERIGEVLFRIDDRGRWAYLSPAYQTVTGRPVESSMGRRALAEIPRSDHAALIAQFRALQSGAAGDLTFATTIVDACGTTRHIEIHMFSLLLDSSERAGMGGIFRDVTARKLLNAQLRESASKAQRAAEASDLAARTDELTGLPNRRAFFERLRDRIDHGAQISLGLFDIDHFKRINDSHGHPAGDEVLRRIAAAAAGRLRDGDMIARIGGEEFAIILEDVPPSGALASAERLLEEIARDGITLPGEFAGGGEDIDIRVTISMGLAHRRDEDSPARLLAEADRALYAAKHGGRNQLRLAA